MKEAFAKLMEMNPTQTSRTAFASGGNNVPILTRASGQSVGGVQTMGLPSGAKPFPGGGANKTVLGAYRMGESDGNAPPSAIYADDIFGPIGPPGRVYPERNFVTTGNNVFQPDNNDYALHALLKRLGDQQFKAKAMQPFEDERVRQAHIAAITEASRNASLSDSATGREIIRSIAAERRQQNNADYLRRMLAGGATPEAAQRELESVLNAQAIQEARTVDDRAYQASTLIQRMAAARGVTPMAREPLTQSAAIDTPQRSQAMSQAMGMPGEGYGTAPADQERQTIGPEFYQRRGLSADETSAFTSMLAQGDIPPPSAGSYSLATMEGQDREQQIDAASETLASRLESIRSRSTRILQPLPTNVIAKDLLDRIYAQKGKRAGASVLVSSETIQDLPPLQLLLALNMALTTDRSAYARLTAALRGRQLGTPERPSPTILDTLRQITIMTNMGEANISIPFVGTRVPITNSELVTILQDIRTSPALRSETQAAVKRSEEAPPPPPMISPLVPRPPSLSIAAPGEEPSSPSTGARQHLYSTSAQYKNIAAIKDQLRMLGNRTPFRLREEGIRLLNAERRKDGLPPLQ